MDKIEFDRCEGLVRNWLRYHPEYEPYENKMDMTSLYHSIIPGLKAEGTKCFNGIIKPFLKGDDNASAPFTFAWDESFTHKDGTDEKRYLIKFYFFPNEYENYMIIENATYELINMLLNKIS